MDGIKTGDIHFNSCQLKRRIKTGRRNLWRKRKKKKRNIQIRDNWPLDPWIKEKSTLRKKTRKKKWNAKSTLQLVRVSQWLGLTASWVSFENLDLASGTGSRWFKRPRMAIIVTAITVTVNCTIIVVFGISWSEIQPLEDTGLAPTQPYNHHRLLLDFF